MNFNNSITENNFISTLENFLLTSDKCLNLSFKSLMSELWNWLCYLPEPLFKKLSKQIGVKYLKNNIGTMQYKIVELLGLGIYLDL